MTIRFFNSAWRKIAWFKGLFLPIKRNKIVVSNYAGKGYGDNAKYIVDELLKQEENYDIIWLVNDVNDSKTLPKGITPSKVKSFESVIHLTTAKVWIDNCRKSFVYKKKAQYYIQTWHGDIGLKKVEGDAGNALSKSYIKNAIKDSQNANLFISGNAWFSKRIREAFFYNGEIAECGCPRCDILYDKSLDFSESIKKRLGINKDKNILLYAPTFRKDKDNPDLSVFMLDWNGVLDALKKKFGGEWVGMIRLHPNISRYSDQLNLPSNVIDVTNYPDMQELLLVADCCITDYSSSLFEFAVTQKPGFLFALDLEEYKKDRDCYFKFDELPFTLAQTNEELINNIYLFTQEDYLEKHRYFYQELLGVFPEGSASKNIAERIRKVCYGK